MGKNKIREFILLEIRISEPTCGFGLFVFHTKYDFRRGLLGFYIETLPPEVHPDKIQTKKPFFIFLTNPF